VWPNPPARHGSAGPSVTPKRLGPVAQTLATAPERPCAFAISCCSQRRPCPVSGHRVGILATVWWAGPVSTFPFGLRRSWGPSGKMLRTEWSGPAGARRIGRAYDGGHCHARCFQRCPPSAVFPLQDGLSRKFRRPAGVSQDDIRVRFVRATGLQERVAENFARFVRVDLVRMPISRERGDWIPR
jgi:hypothetical protein